MRGPVLWTGPLMNVRDVRLYCAKVTFIADPAAYLKMASRNSSRWRQATLIFSRSSSLQSRL